MNGNHFWTILYCRYLISKKAQQRIQLYKHPCLCVQTSLYVCVFNSILIKNLLTKSLQLPSVILLCLSFLNSPLPLCLSLPSVQKNWQQSRRLKWLIKKNPDRSLSVFLSVCWHLLLSQLDVDRCAATVGERRRNGWERDGEIRGGMEKKWEERKKERAKKRQESRVSRIQSTQTITTTSSQTNTHTHTHTSARSVCLFKLKCQNAL